MNAENYYDYFDGCNGRWIDAQRNMFMFIRPTNGLPGIALKWLPGDEKVAFDISYNYRIDFEGDCPVLYLNDEKFSFRIFNDESMVLGETEYALK